MWFLRGSKSKYKIDGKRTLGNANFPTDKSVSEQHVELRNSDGRLFVFDLGSVSGTFINGLQLLPGIKGELKNGQTLRIGNTELRAEFDETFEEATDAPTDDGGEWVWAVLAVAVYAAVTFVYFSLPSMAYGKSIGNNLSLAVAGVLALSTALVAFPLAALLMRLEEGLLRYAIFAGTLAAGSLLMFNLILNLLDDQYPIARNMLAAKIGYFCKSHFQDRLCAQEISQCPACLEVVERFNAEKKAESAHLFNPAIPSALAPRKPITNPNAPIQ